MKKWQTFKTKGGAEYQWICEDHCIAVKVKNGKPIWIELQALQFFESTLYLKEI